MVDLGMAYCANRPLQDMFYIGEMATIDDTTEPRPTRSGSKLTSANSYGAVYFPWVKALDPTGRSPQPILLPPSGYIAGLYARIDATRGVWKAPAGTEASLNGVVGLADELSDVQHGNLNPIGVNVIRRFAGAGVVVLRRADDDLRPGVEIRAGAAHRDHAAGQHLQRHPVGGVRAQRRAAVVAAAAEHRRRS